jgi:peptidoglycan hydrolase-like protein with peptidoglycan-binding domain
MPTLQRGHKGPEVKQLQQKLKDHQFYFDIVDGDFGGNTESAVVQFQKANGLAANGTVDEGLWGLLFPDEPFIPKPVVTGKPLLDRCLELTGAFETSLPPPGCYAKTSGNFDKMGISFGALQWNLGQGSLQALFARIEKRDPSLIDDIFHVHAAEWRNVLQKPKTDAVAWAASVQTPKHQLFEPWRGLFRAIGQREECHQVQCEFVKDVFEKALQLCREYDLQSERAVALFFDIITQNGSIKPDVKKLIVQDFKGQPRTGNIRNDEPARLRIVANRRADTAGQRWRNDVRTRKLTIANGVGVVHGGHYDLEKQYNIRLVKAEGL